MAWLAGRPGAEQRPPSRTTESAHPEIARRSPASHSLTRSFTHSTTISQLSLTQCTLLCIEEQQGTRLSPSIKELKIINKRKVREREVPVMGRKEAWPARGRQGLRVELEW